MHDMTDKNKGHTMASWKNGLAKSKRPFWWRKAGRDLPFYLLVYITVALSVAGPKLEFQCISLADVHSNLLSETLWSRRSGEMILISV